LRPDGVQNFTKDVAIYLRETEVGDILQQVQQLGAPLVYAERQFAQVGHAQNVVGEWQQLGSGAAVVKNGLSSSWKGGPPISVWCKRATSRPSKKQSQGALSKVEIASMGRPQRRSSGMRCRHAATINSSIVGVRLKFPLNSRYRSCGICASANATSSASPSISRYVVTRK
jgi:hypothetical protein